MSSMRNAVQRRNHRERAQPRERQKWGLLEKPKDYKLRAADHKVKKRKIKALQHKASERNEDEFNFGMMSGQSQGGIKVAKRGQENSGGGGKVLSNETVQLMKTQDVGYLRTMLQQTRRERERLGRDVIAGDVGVDNSPSKPTNEHVVFGDEKQSGVPPGPPQESTNEEVGEWLDSDEDDSKPDQVQLSPEEQKKRHVQDVRRRKFGAMKEREEDLAAALEEVERQRAKMNGSIGGVNKNGVKFKVRQRKQ